MKQDEIIKMARKAGARQMVSSLTHPNGPVTALKFDLDNGSIEAFTKLVEEKAIKEALAQTGQEPVAWMQPDEVHISLWKDDYHIIPLYTTPPKRTWVGISEEEKIQFMVAYYSSNWDTKTLIAVMDNYEAQLRSKNTRGKE